MFIVRPQPNIGASSVRSGMWGTDWAQWYVFAMSLLTELGQCSVGTFDCKYGAPSGAFGLR
jgi:hypothetical protein